MRLGVRVLARSTAITNKQVQSTAIKYLNEICLTLYVDTAGIATIRLEFLSKRNKQFWCS